MAPKNHVVLQAMPHYSNLLMGYSVDHAIVDGRFSKQFPVQKLIDGQVKQPNHSAPISGFFQNELRPTNYNYMPLFILPYYN